LSWLTEKTAPVGSARTALLKPGTSKAGTTARPPSSGARSAASTRWSWLETVFDPGAAGDLDASYELRLDRQPFSARVAGGRLEFVRGSAAAPDATIETDPTTLPDVLWRGRRLADAERAGEIKIEGERQVARRFLSLFRLPAR
jgi:alkyl sulfatase BDS1-like metallo-beta-lactamase superfamily hydrolase